MLMQPQASPTKLKAYMDNLRTIWTNSARMFRRASKLNLEIWIASNTCHFHLKRARLVQRFRSWSTISRELKMAQENCYMTSRRCFHSTLITRCIRLRWAKAKKSKTFKLLLRELSNSNNAKEMHRSWLEFKNLLKLKLRELLQCSKQLRRFKHQNSSHRTLLKPSKNTKKNQSNSLPIKMKSQLTFKLGLQDTTLITFLCSRDMPRKQKLSVSNHLLFPKNLLSESITKIMIDNLNYFENKLQIY